jgi:L-rhamnose isomerase
MTQDEIIEMAKKAGFPFNKYDLLQGDDEGEIDAHEMFEAFAKLVAAKEREACAKVCEEEGKLWSMAGCTDTQTFVLCATVIRERGEA